MCLVEVGLRPSVYSYLGGHYGALSLTRDEGALRVERPSGLSQRLLSLIAMNGDMQLV